jgi:hypothetical protein
MASLPNLYLSGVLILRRTWVLPSALRQGADNGQTTGVPAQLAKSTRDRVALFLTLSIEPRVQG